ncbi:putative aldouronate transport system substrate-binding protein [Paenibacillus sp. yr247]|uniref:hypothetical protein n=1 Tax=Paenibacillus sp. yr247 TaxID=1761880 RepID=UPI0008812442|nr:hypothetical protein [Paenibacillus sp. yr247]SDO19330.1 putative aldouronate transport system substrate-binding protein [Paenibacillus sp. yr247]
MKKMRMTTIACSVLVLSGLLAGCSKSPAISSTSKPSTDNVATTTTTPVGDKKADPVKVDWYVDLSWWKYQGDLGKDEFSKLIRDKFGLDINFITPAADDGQKMAAMIASNTLPDIITYEGWKDDPGYKLFKSGSLASMDQLIEKYTPEFKDKVYKDVADWYRQSDGHFYGLPNYAYSKFEMKPGEKLEPNSGFTLRKDILEKLGNPDISTADKFMNVLERVKNEVKTYDGKPLIPLQLYEFTDKGSGSINWLQQYFSTPFEDKNGNFLDVRFQENYYAGIKFLNEAYRKGLISQDNFTDKRDQINEKVASGKVFAMLTANQDFDAQYRTLYRADNKAQYQAFALRNNKGEELYLQDLRGYGWLLTSVNKNTKYADRITKLIAFLNSKEGQYMTEFGFEGKTYTKSADGTFQKTEEFDKGLASGESAKKYGVGMGIGFNLQQDWLTVKDMYAKPTKPEDIYMQDIKKPLLPFSYDFNAANPKFDPENVKYNEMTDLKNKLDLLWGRLLPKMILADSEAKSRQAYDDAIAKMKDAGWDKLNTFNQEMYQATKKRLGTEYGWPGNAKK